MNRANYFAKYTKDDLQLIKLFKEELEKLNTSYIYAINSNDTTKAAALLKKMQSIVKTMESQYWERATKRIPQEYLLGSKYIDDTLTKENSYIEINNATTKELYKMVEDLGAIHVEAVNALLNNSKMYVKSSLDGMERQALTMLTELQQEKVREKLARSTITGDSLQTMKEKVARYFKENQITVFKDRGGKTRTLDRYIDMLVRTETSIANIQGTINRAIQIGITKFRVVEQADCCELCKEYRGEIVDITDGTVDLPPYHPNCRGYIVVVIDPMEKEQVEEKLKTVKPKKQAKKVADAETKSDDIQDKKATTPEERTAKALDVIENSTQYLKHEQGAFVNLNWDIIRMASGLKNCVKMPRNWINEPYIMTHNHPNSSSFSFADLSCWWYYDNEYWLRASSKIGTYSLYAESKVARNMFIDRYNTLYYNARENARADMNSFAKAWSTGRTKDFIRFNDGTVFLRDEDTLKFDKLIDEHYRKYYREALEKAAEKTQGVKFEFIPNDGVQKDTLLNKMYLNKEKELAKLRRSKIKQYEDGGNLEINDYI